PLPIPPRPLPMPRIEGRVDGAAKAAAGATVSAAVEPGEARDAATADSARAAAPEARIVILQQAERLGTGHGERETSVARVTTFDRATIQPEQRVEIR